MKWMASHIEIFVLIILLLVGVLIGLASLSFYKLKKFIKQSNESQIVMKANLELSTSTSITSVNIELFNASFKPIFLSQLGFIFKNQKIDLYQEACEILNKDKIHLEERSYLNFKMSIARFESILYSIIGKDKKIKKIRCFVCDCVGFEKVSKAKNLKKALQRRKNQLCTLKKQNQILVTNQNKTAI